MNVKIYKPSKCAMQSGHGKANEWVLEPITTSGKKPEALMGWTASKDTLSQIDMKFSSKEAAITFAESKGWSYTVAKEQVRRVKPRNYMDNFAYSEPKETINK